MSTSKKMTKVFRWRERNKKKWFIRDKLLTRWLHVTPAEKRYDDASNYMVDDQVKKLGDAI